MDVVADGGTPCSAFPDNSAAVTAYRSSFRLEVEQLTGRQLLRSLVIRCA